MSVEQEDVNFRLEILLCRISPHPSAQGDCFSSSNLFFKETHFATVATMSRIEELPDDFNETVNLRDVSKGPSIEELYNQHISEPGVEQTQAASKSFEEIVQDMSKTPLFMNSLDDATEGTPNTTTAHVLG